MTAYIKKCEAPLLTHQNRIGELGWHLTSSPVKRHKKVARGIRTFGARIKDAILRELRRDYLHRTAKLRRHRCISFVDHIQFRFHQIDGVSSNHDAEDSRLNDALHFAIQKRKFIETESQFHRLGFAGVERDAAEASQFLHRPRDGADLPMLWGNARTFAYLNVE